MKNARGMVTNSIFSRILLIFLLIMIPIYAMGLYIYNWSLRTVKNEIFSSTVSQSSFYLQGLEREIERMKILQYDCLQDTELTNLAIRWSVLSRYERNQNMLRLQQRLKTIKNSSVYIANVSAHILPIRRTISANSGVDDIHEEKYEQVRVKAGVRGAQIVRYMDGYYLSTIQEGNVTGYNPMFMIEIELDLAAFEEALSQFNSYEGSGSLLIFPDDGSVLSAQKQPSAMEGQLAVLREGDAAQSILLDGTEYLLPRVHSNYLQIELLRYIPAHVVQSPLRHFYIWMWVFTLLALGLVLVFSLSIFKVMHKPLVVLVESFQKVEGGDLQATIAHDGNHEFAYLYGRFNDMTANLRKLIDEVLEQKLLMQRAELKQLQSQINPHFLYNSFFMIQTMAWVGDENLVPFARLLGEYFRFITRNDSDEVSLEDEVRHARAYAEIQRMRFPRRLEVRFAECPQAFRSLRVPRLILQPLIENAFAHGVERKTENGLIEIHFEQTEEALRIIVSDNGSDMDDAALVALQAKLSGNNAAAETTGLMNIDRRLRLVFGTNSGLSASRSAWGGMKMVLTIQGRGEKADAQIADRG